METITSVLSGAGGFLLGTLAISMWYGGGNKTVAVWIGFAGAICFALVAAIQMQDYVWRLEKPIPRTENPDRPWVDVNVEIASPLVYDDKGWDAGTRWHILLRYRLNNTGKLPATDIDIHADIIPLMLSYWPDDQIKGGIPQGTPVAGTNVPAELTKLCESLAAMNRHMGSFMGLMLFANETTTQTFHVNINPAHIRRAQETAFGGNLVLLTRVTYRFKDDGGPHQTAVSHVIFRDNAKIDLSGAIQSVSDLRIMQQPMGGSFAN